MSLTQANKRHSLSLSEEVSEWREKRERESRRAEEHVRNKRRLLAYLFIFGFIHLLNLPSAIDRRISIFRIQSKHFLETQIHTHTCTNSLS